MEDLGKRLRLRGLRSGRAARPGRRELCELRPCTRRSSWQIPQLLVEGHCCLLWAASLPGGRNILYRNLGKGRFQDVTLSAHIDRTMGQYCFSVSPFDFDNDGWPDIYMSCDSAPSILYHNNRDGTFTDVGILSGVAYNVDGREQAGMGSTVADYDGDGNLDLFRTNFSDGHPHALSQ